MRRKTVTEVKRKTYLQACILYWREDNACIYIGSQSLPAWSRPYLKQIKRGIYRTIELQVPGEWTLHVIPAISYTQARSSSIIDPISNYREEIEDIESMSEPKQPYTIEPDYAKIADQEEQRRASLQNIREIADIGLKRLHELTVEQKDTMTVEDVCDLASALFSYTEIIAMHNAMQTGRPIHLTW